MPWKTKKTKIRNGNDIGSAQNRIKSVMGWKCETVKYYKVSIAQMEFCFWFFFVFKNENVWWAEKNLRRRKWKIQKKIK